MCVGQCEEIQLEREEVSRRLGIAEESCKGQSMELSILKEELASSQVMNKQVHERCEQLEENRTRVTRESLLSESDVRHSPIFLGKGCFDYSMLQNTVPPLPMSHLLYLLMVYSLVN